MKQIIPHCERLSGELSLPGDKSISHRALIFAAMAEGESKITHCSDGEDVRRTAECLGALSASIIWEEDFVIVKGCGYRGFKEPEKPLYCGNSGTTARLLAGLCAAQPFGVNLAGDDSLSQRPMKRIAEPLTAAGAAIEAAPGDRLPIHLKGSAYLKPIHYELPLPSAQVKSALLIAGLHSEEQSRIIEPAPTRNHTELMLGLRTEKIEDKNYIFASRKDYPVANELYVPADISTAAFFITAALIIPDSNLKLCKVSVNPTRTAFIDILQMMGADIRMENLCTSGSETYSDIICGTSSLKNITTDRGIIPGIIDEIPILSVAALFAEGDFTIRGAGELRMKECDRINALCEMMRKTGVSVEEYNDGFSLSGKPCVKERIEIHAFGDHRIAMAGAVLAAALPYGGVIEGFETVNISNPHFIKQWENVTGEVWRK